MAISIRWKWPPGQSNLTSDSLILRWLAWGDRRYVDGTPQPPLTISTSLGAWLRWIAHRPRGVTLVSPARTHKRAFVEALRQPASDAVELSLSEALDIDAQRKAARASRNFALADVLRDRLTSAGYFVEDRPVVVGEPFVWEAPEPIEAALQGRCRARPVNLLSSGALAYDTARQ